MNIKKIVSIHGILLCILLLLLPVSVRAKSTVNMNLDYGFQNNAKSGSCFPLNIYLENTGDAFQGSLEISVPIMGDNMGITNSLWMGVSEWGNYNDRVYRYQKEIVLEKGEKKKETFYLELPAFEGYLEVRVKSGNAVLCEDSLTCGFSENSSRILVGIVSPDLSGMESLDGMQIQTDNGYGLESFVKTIPLQSEDIYPNPDAFSQLDVLIADQGTEFTTEQQIALNRWKENGGFYIERNGEDLFELFCGFLNGERSSDFQKHLDQMISYSFGDDGGVSQVPVRVKPSMGKYLVILCIYAVAAGPGIYLLLRKRNKRRYLWSYICVLSVIFMGIISIMGKSTNLYAPIISYNGLYEQQNGVWSETLQIGIQAPYNSAYHLYLENEYRLLPLNIGSDCMKEYRSDTSESVVIQMGEKNNRVTMDNMASFVQNCFKLEKNRETGTKQMQLSLQGDGKQVSGTWKNSTGYDICNAVLVMQNRAAVLGDLESGKEKTITESTLYSCGNGGIELLIKELMDFNEFQYPDYEITNLSSQVWSALRDRKPDQIYLIGIVTNPDLSFEGDSGYKIYGSTLFQMAVDVDWNSDGYLWCPNMEAYGFSRNGEFSSETNLINGKEATVDYRTDQITELKVISFSHADYDDDKYYFPFIGKVALYCWETDTFEEIQNWETTLEGERLNHFLSENGTIRVRYLLDDTINTVNRSCMLPCLTAAGKVESYASN